MTFCSSGGHWQRRQAVGGVDVLGLGRRRGRAGSTALRRLSCCQHHLLAVVRAGSEEGVSDEAKTQAPPASFAGAHGGCGLGHERVGCPSGFRPGVEAGPGRLVGAGGCSPIRHDQQRPLSPRPRDGGEMQVYVIFWEPRGSFVSSKFNMLIRRYFRDVGDSGLYANNAQYPDSSGQAPAGAELAGWIVDSSPYPSTPVLQDSDIRNEVSHAMSVEGWTPGITHMFFVYTALNESICVPFFGSCSPPFGSMCGYHFGFGTPGGPVLYAGMPYAGNSLAQCYGLGVTPIATLPPMPRLTPALMSRWRRQPIPRPVAGSALVASLMKSLTNASVSLARSTQRAPTSISKAIPIYCRKSGTTRFLAVSSPGRSLLPWSC